MFLVSSKYEKLVKLLCLDKPLLIFDVTTTGPGISSDKIIHLAYVKIWPDGRVKKSDCYFNPEFRISAESVAIHGIRNRFLKDKPIFRQKAQEIWEEFHDCYYGGFNVQNFDLPILRREFVRVGMDFDYSNKRIIDSKTIFHYMAPRTIPMAYEYYVGKEYKGEYSAKAHTELVTDILIKQLEKYKEARNPEFIKMIHETYENVQLGATRKFYWVNGEAYFAFSKYKDQSVSSIVKKDKDFLLWILDADFRDDTKNIIRQALDEEKKK
jgi:DNA polymerase III subunit epsilon